MADFATAAAIIADKNKSSGQSWNPNMRSSRRETGNRALNIHTPPISIPIRTTSANTDSQKAAMLAHLASQQSQTLPVSQKAAQGPKPRNRAPLAALTSCSVHTPQETEQMVTTPGLQSGRAQQNQQTSPRHQEHTSRSQTQGSKIINMAPECLTEHPPIRLEREEKAHKEALHVSAVALAKQVFAKRDTPARQDRHVDLEEEDDDDDLYSSPEHRSESRLARLQAADDRADLHGYNGRPTMHSTAVSSSSLNRSQSQNFLRRPKPPLAPVQPLRSTSSAASSDGDNEERATQIREEVSALNARLDRVDARLKSQNARLKSKNPPNILAVARQRVQQHLSQMDEKVFAQTGKMSPPIVVDWEEKSRLKRLMAGRSPLKSRRRSTPTITTPWSEKDDKWKKAQETERAVDVGGGRMMDSGDIEQLAVSRVKPTLEKIDKGVELRRKAEHEAEEQENERKRAIWAEKQRRKEQKEAERQLQIAEQRKRQAIKEAGDRKRQVEKEAEQQKKNAIKNAELQRKLEENQAKEMRKRREKDEKERRKREEREAEELRKKQVDEAEERRRQERAAEEMMKQQAEEAKERERRQREVEERRRLGILAAEVKAREALEAEERRKQEVRVVAERKEKQAALELEEQLKREKLFEEQRKIEEQKRLDERKKLEQRKLEDQKRLEEQRIREEKIAEERYSQLLREQKEQNNKFLIEAELFKEEEEESKQRDRTAVIHQTPKG
jgi:hypothetical protein